MSHFVVAVIGGDHESQLEPFSEEYEVEPHEEECWCLERIKGKIVPKKDCEECEGKGVYMSSCNPDGRWDWYTEGGRWENYLKLTQEAIDEGGYGDKEWVDSANVGQVDWMGMIEKVKAERRKTWDHMQKVFAGEEDEGNFDGFNGITKDTKFDDYVNKNWGIAPYSILHDGEWIESGTMGWFGMSTNQVDEEDWDMTFIKNIKSLDPDTEITIVDCHV